MEREVGADFQDVLQLLLRVLRKLHGVRAAEGAQRGRIEAINRLPPLGDQDQGDVPPPRLLAESRERVHEFGPALLQEDIDLVQDDHEVDLLLLQPLPEGVELLGDGETAVREPRVEVLQDMEEDRVVPHLLPTVHMDMVEAAALLVRVHAEILAEPLRGMRLPGPHGTVQERVGREAAVPNRAEDREHPLKLALAVGELLRDIVEGDLRPILEHGGPRAEAHLALIRRGANKSFGGEPPSRAGWRVGRRSSAMRATTATRRARRPVGAMLDTTLKRTRPRRRSKPISGSSTCKRRECRRPSRSSASRESRFTRPDSAADGRHASRSSGGTEPSLNTITRMPAETPRHSDGFNGPSKS